MPEKGRNPYQISQLQGKKVAAKIIYVVEHILVLMFIRKSKQIH